MSTELGREGVYNRQQIEDRLIDEFLGLCRGILLDGDVHDKEVVRLDQWMAAHPALSGVWPVNTISARVAAALEDGLVEEAEREELARILEKLVGDEPASGADSTALPIDSPEPVVTFRDRGFTFTGTFVFGSRKACEAEVIARKGKLNSMSREISYLVIGSKATKAWAHSSFGRKIEGAINMRAEGYPVAIISEKHWVEALRDTPSHDPAVALNAFQRCIESAQPMSFLYRGSKRTILPHRFVTWLNQPAVEGLYLDGESPDPERSVRQYLLAHIDLDVTGKS